MPISTVTQQLRDANKYVPYGNSNMVNINVNEDDNDFKKSELTDLKVSILNSLFYTNQKLDTISNKINNLQINELWDDADTKIKLNTIQREIVESEKTASPTEGFSVGKAIGVTAGGIGLASIISQFVDIKDIFSRIGESLSGILGSFSNFNFSDMIGNMFGFLKKKFDEFNLQDFVNSMIEKISETDFTKVFNGFFDALSGLVAGIAGVDFKKTFEKVQRDIEEFKPSKLFDEFFRSFNKFVEDITGLDIKKIVGAVNVGILDFKVLLIDAQDGIRKFTTNINETVDKFMKTIEPLLIGFASFLDRIHNLVKVFKAIEENLSINFPFVRKAIDIFTSEEMSPNLNRVLKDSKERDISSRIELLQTPIQDQISVIQKEQFDLQKQLYAPNISEEQTKEINSKIEEKRKIETDLNQAVNSVKNLTDEYKNMLEAQSKNQAFAPSDELKQVLDEIKKSEDSEKENRKNLFDSLTSWWNDSKLKEVLVDRPMSKRYVRDELDEIQKEYDKEESRTRTLSKKQRDEILDPIREKKKQYESFLDNPYGVQSETVTNFLKGKNIDITKWEDSEEEEEDTSEPILKESATTYRISGGKLTTDSRSVTEKEWQGVDPRLKRIMKLAAERSGYDIVVTSGKEGRSTGTPQHPIGKAVDIRLIDPSGNVLTTDPNDSSPRNVNMARKYFRDYEKIGQIAKQIADEEGVPFRWGGYFGGEKGMYDVPHYDIMPSGMSQGSWKTGLYESALKSTHKGFHSQGMGNVPLVTARNAYEEEEEEEINSTLPQNTKMAMEFFMKKGLSSKDAAAIVANLMAEGKVVGDNDISPKAENKRSHAFGIAQWLGSRLQELKKRPNYDTMQVQLDFLWDELTGKTPDKTYSKVLKEMSEISSLEEKTTHFTDKFERPGKFEKHYATRQRFARKLLNESDTNTKREKSFGEKYDDFIKRMFSGTGKATKINIEDLFQDSIDSATDFLEKLDILPPNIKEIFSDTFSKMGQFGKGAFDLGKTFIQDEKFREDSIKDIIQFFTGQPTKTPQQEEIETLLSDEKTKKEITNIIVKNPKDTIRKMTEYFTSKGMNEDKALKLSQTIRTSIPDISSEKTISSGLQNLLPKEEPQEKVVGSAMIEALKQAPKSFQSMLEFGKMFANDKEFRDTQFQGFYGLSKDDEILNKLLKDETSKNEMVDLLKNNPTNTVGVLSDYLKSKGVSDENVLEMANKVRSSISDLTSKEGISKGLQNILTEQGKEIEGSLKGNIQELFGYDLSQIQNIAQNKISEVLGTPSTQLGEGTQQPPSVNVINAGQEPRIIPVPQSNGTFPMNITNEVPYVRDSAFMEMVYSDYYAAAEHLHN